MSADKNKGAKPPVKRKKKSPQPAAAKNLAQQVSTRCLTCNHESVGEINELLVAGSTNTDVAKRFGLPINAVQRHKVNHLSRALQQAEVEYQRSLSLEVQTFREETYLSTLDKLKYTQEQILNDLENLDPLGIKAAHKKSPLYKLWLDTLTQEAKLLNLYEPDKAQSLREINKRIALIVGKELRKDTYNQDVSGNDSKEVKDNDPSTGSRDDTRPVKDNGLSAGSLTPANIELAEKMVEQICLTFNFIYGQELANPVDVISILSR